MSNIYFFSVNNEIIPVYGVIFNENKEVVSISILKTNRTKSLIREILKRKIKIKIRSFEHVVNDSPRVKVKGELSFNGPKMNLINSIQVKFIKNGEILTYGIQNVINESIFLKNNIENKEEFLKKTISEKLVNLSPLPIVEEDLDYISNLLLSELEPLNIIKTPNFDYKDIFYININNEKNIDIIKRAIIKKYSQNQFKEIMGRAPELESILNMINPKNLNMKTWGKVINHFGGREKFAEINYNRQVNIVWGYEFFKDKIIDIVDYLDSIDIPVDFLPFKELAINIYKNPINSNSDFDMNRYIARFKEFDTGIHLFSYLSIVNDEDFLKDFLEITVSKKRILDFMKSRDFNSIKKGGEVMSMICAELLLSEATFATYQEKYIEAMESGINSPIGYPTVSGEIENTKYSWECIDMRNPRAWVVGLETNCCQNLHGLGKSCVLFAAHNIEISGIFRVMKNNKTVAQSFFWIHRSSGTFVFDNIEVLGGEIHENIYRSYEAFIDELEKRKDIFGFTSVTFGAGYTDIEKSRYSKVEPSKKVLLSSVPNGRGVYSDASNTQYLMRQFKKEVKND